MKQFDIFINFDDDEKNELLFLPVELDKLSKPLTMTKGGTNSEEEDKEITRKKSEIIDKDNEMFMNCLKQESVNKIKLNDADNKVLLGNVHNTEKNEDGSGYYTIINQKDAMVMTPISNWHKFFIKSGYSEINLDDVQLNTNTPTNEEVIEPTKERFVNDADIELTFDDDNSEDEEIILEDNVVLDQAGLKMQKLIKDLSDKEKKEIRNRKQQKLFSKSLKNRRLEMKESDIIEIIANQKVTIRDLAFLLHQKFKISKESKQLLNDFLKNKVQFIQENDKKYLKLK